MHQCVYQAGNGYSGGCGSYDRVAQAMAVEVSHGMSEIVVGLVVFAVVVPAVVAIVAPTSIRHVAYAVCPTSRNVMRSVVHNNGTGSAMNYWTMAHLITATMFDAVTTASLHVAMTTAAAYFRTMVASAHLRAATSTTHFCVTATTHCATTVIATSALSAHIHANCSHQDHHHCSHCSVHRLHNRMF